MVGSLYVARTTFREAKNKVATDLRVARNFLNKELEKSLTALELISENELIKNLTEKTEPSSQKIRAWLEKKRINLGFDILSICNQKGEVILRSRPPYYTGDSCLSIPFIHRTLLQGESLAGIVVVPAEKLKMEGEDLAEQAKIIFKPTPRAKPRLKETEISGMFLMSAVPLIQANGKIGGVLYGGKILNRNYRLVDYIRDMVFEEKEYKGKPFGTVTIFQGDVRIATNVKEEDSSRAIGTRVSEEVYEKVLEQGKMWLGRAFVVNNWYISAYEPIRNLDDEIIGILYVGVLEQKYIDIRNGVLLTFLPIILGGIAAALIISYLLSRDLSQPLKRLVKATERIARGQIQYTLEKQKEYPRIQELPYLEIQELVGNFNRMATALHKRETQLKRTNEDLKKINRNYMEILGFVTHEIKNRLGIIMGSSYNLKGEVVGKLNQGQKKMVDILLRNAERLNVMIKNYLDLSRIERGELRVNKQKIDFKEDILNPVLKEFTGEIEAKGLLLETKIPAVSKIMADPDLLKIVLENLLSNAIKYGKEKGKIKIGVKKENLIWKINVWNEGEGIPRDNIDKLFIKFTRLGGEKFKKERGSGLGLFITKEIIQKHGGKIWAESEEGKWANFIFTLPSN